MTTPPIRLSERARQGDVEAIAALMNRPLQPKGITADVEAWSDQLQIRLEADGTPNRSVLKQFAYRGLSNLGIPSVNRVKLYGFRRGEQTPVWEDEFDLPPYLNSSDTPTVQDAAIATAIQSPLNPPTPVDTHAAAPVEAPSSDGLDFLDPPASRLEPSPRLESLDPLPRHGRDEDARPLEEPIPRALTDDDISPRHEAQGTLRATEAHSVSMGEEMTGETSSSDSNPLRLLLIAAAALLLGLTTVLAGIFAYRTLFNQPRGQVQQVPASPPVSPLPPPTATPPAGVATPASPGIPPTAGSPAAIAPAPTVNPNPTQPNQNPAIAPPTPAPAAISDNPYTSAETRAAEAETLSRTATTAQEWQRIAALWQESATWMARIPAGDANYQTAQQRVAEYLSNRDYARQRAAGAPQ
ncbi:MAG: hypothetical protein HC881_03040 [Leptolyngbyaceae cyanobacterium SL_7_1]|nr:hypothetical protein [Leptolyngbyaceae cyanobacterium SL_7_1]